MTRYGVSVLPPVGADFPVSMPFPILEALIDEVGENIKSPRPLVVFSLLTTLSVLIQGVYDVCKPDGQCVPLSLLLLTLAESGERKSSTENVFLNPIKEFQRKQELVFKNQLDEWSAKDEIWAVKNKELLKKVASLTKSGMSVETVEPELIRHRKARPSKPRKFKMLYDDSTSEALFRGLNDNLKTAGIISSEGGLKGRAFNDVVKQNSMWSGDPIVVDRKGEDSYELHDARLTVSIMTQPSAFKSYMETRGEHSRGSGFWARFLISQPESTQGTRWMTGGQASWAHLNGYKYQFDRLLLSNLELITKPDKARGVVSFSREAAAHWRDVFNEIEYGIGDGGRFFRAGDLASKLADNIARVAALLHVFEHGESEISLEILKYSVDFCLWCSDQFYSVFMPPRELDLDVYALQEWFNSLRRSGKYIIQKNRILQCGPRRLRTKKRLEATLDELCERQVVSCIYDAGTTFVKF